MKRLGIEGIDELSPAVMRFELFHYLHKKHAALAASIAVVFEEMRASGELARLRDHVVAVLLDLAEKGLPLCDDDYACFETPTD